MRANDSAMSPPVLISFSRRSSLRRRGLSAMNSATATAPGRGTAGAGHGPTPSWPPTNPACLAPAPRPCAHPTLARELGRGQAKAQHAAVANEAIFEVADALIPNGVVAQVQRLQALCVRLQEVACDSEEKPRKTIRKEANLRATFLLKAKPLMFL